MAARQFLLQDAQAGLVEKQMESLMVEKKLQTEEGFPERTIITVGGRQKKHLRIAYDQDELPVLPPDHELARLYLQEAHELDHAGVDAMIMRSRSRVGIIRIRPKAQAVKNACFTCRSWETRRWPPFLPTGWGQRRPFGPRPWICSGHSPSRAP
jgi:hypothetical protein